ncbi:hypothetical protein [Chryseobacterium sp. PCH239]|uniref:hypothetical protein n=1 Tax=Chryseobacterium sp. PCH239 TaxID=2825845 RepID=UPI0020A1FDCA|nr:hypothetical protein [Chryseobacterium sp. PCH239]
MIQPRFKDAPHFRNFWEHGNGRQLIEFSGAKVSFEKFEKFAPYFYHTDETGDEVVKDVYFTKKFHEASREIEHYIRNGVSETDDVSESVKNCSIRLRKFLIGSIINFLKAVLNFV